MKVLSCGPKASNISGILDAISPRHIRKNPRSMYARVPHGMAQFVLKIENLKWTFWPDLFFSILQVYSIL